MLPSASGPFVAKHGCLMALALKVSEVAGYRVDSCCSTAEEVLDAMLCCRVLNSGVLPKLAV